MSEFQYYEFLAIDRPLSDDDKRWLRSLSSRAQITSTSLTNTYHWGSFKGDPDKLLKRCFDAHIYTSNFGTRRFSLKLPADARAQRAMSPYCDECGVALSAYPDGVLLDFALEGDPGDWDDDDGDGIEWMSRLAALRAELLDGDWRSLYLAWLLNVQFATLDDDEREPPVPPGLGALSAPCEALVEFLQIDRTLLAVAVEQSAPVAATGMSEREWRGLLAGLSATEKDDLLLQFIMHDDAATRRSVRTRLRDRGISVADEPAGGKKRHESGGRTVGELTSNWRRREADAQKLATEAAARERARVAEEKARDRQKHLVQVADREPAFWKEVNSLIASRTPKGYERAVALLVDLRDAAALMKQIDRFAAQLRDLRAAHGSKPRLVKQMDVAELR